MSALPYACTLSSYWAIVELFYSSFPSFTLFFPLGGSLVAVILPPTLMKTSQDPAATFLLVLQPSPLLIARDPAAFGGSLCHFHPAEHCPVAHAKKKTQQKNRVVMRTEIIYFYSLSIYFASINFLADPLIANCQSIFSLFFFLFLLDTGKTYKNKMRFHMWEIEDNSWWKKTIVPSLPSPGHRLVTAGLETMLNADQRLQIHSL